MALLSDHVNVYSSCIALLSMQGWEVEIEPCSYEEMDSLLDFFVAKRNGTTIRADDPLRLLGLAAIDQHHQPHNDEPYWWAIESTPPDLYERLENEALERSFFIYKKKSPEDCRLLLIKTIKESKDYPSHTIHTRLGISEESFNEIIKGDIELQSLINGTNS